MKKLLMTILLISTINNGFANSSNNVYSMEEEYSNNVFESTRANIIRQKINKTIKDNSYVNKHKNVAKPRLSNSSDILRKKILKNLNKIISLPEFNVY